MKMKIILCLIPIFIHISHIMNMKLCFDVNSYMGDYRMSTISRGNYTIYSLVEMSRDSENCSKVTDTGILKMYVLKYGLQKINNKLKNYNIGLRIDDICTNLKKTMERSMEFISLYRPNTICREEFLQCSMDNAEHEFQPPVAVIGTAFSYTSVPLASLTAFFKIPQISYAASSRVLSNEVYESFFRTIPSDDMQVLAMIDILKKFNWNFVFAVGSDDDYGELGLAHLKRESWKVGLCVAEVELVHENDQARIKEVIQNIIDTPNAKVVVLFCHFIGVGDMLLAEAKRRKVERIWLTSEAWSPVAESMNKDLASQAQGILTVFLQHSEIPGLKSYIMNEIKQFFQCDLWLRNFLKHRYKCEAFRLSEDETFLEGDECVININNMTDSLLKLIKGYQANIFYAVTALGEGIENITASHCNGKFPCMLERIDPVKLTEALKYVTFTNKQGNQFKFDKNGDPAYAFYSIENLQIIDGSFNYVAVGTWSSKRNHSEKLEFDENIIKWPDWFKKNSINNYPTSLCSVECKKGEYVKARIGCCWTCDNCTGNNYTDINMARECLSCENGWHTTDHIKCHITPTVWMTKDTVEGMAIVIISGVGLGASLILGILTYKKWIIIKRNEKSPHLITLLYVVGFISFSSDFLYIIRPTALVCRTRGIIFFLIFMCYSTLLLLNSKYVTSYLKRQSKWLFLNQLVALLTLLCIEILSVIITWLSFPNDNPPLINHDNLYEIKLRCFVALTTPRLVSIVMPCIVLVVASFFAFKERDSSHFFYETKLLNFASVSICIIAVAFLPAIQYANNDYKAVTMALAKSIFSYIFMTFLLLPKLISGYIVNKVQPIEEPIEKECGVCNGRERKITQFQEYADVNDSSECYGDVYMGEITKSEK